MGQLSVSSSQRSEKDQAAQRGRVDEPADGSSTDVIVGTMADRDINLVNDRRMHVRVHRLRLQVRLLRVGSGSLKLKRPDVAALDSDHFLGRQLLSCDLLRDHTHHEAIQVLNLIVRHMGR